MLLEICDIGRVKGKYKYGQCCCCLYGRLWGKTVQVNGELFTEVWKSEQNECCAIGRGTLGYFGISSWCRSRKKILLYLTQLTQVMCVSLCYDKSSLCESKCLTQLKTCARLPMFEKWNMWVSKVLVKHRQPIWVHAIIICHTLGNHYTTCVNCCSAT